MTVEHHNPRTLVAPRGYSQATVASGSRIVFLSGQTAIDPDGRLIGAGDYRVQAAQALSNLWHALADSGGTPADLARLSIFVADHTPEREELVLAGLADAAAALGIAPTAGYLIGVTALGGPGALVEIDGTAVLD